MLGIPTTFRCIGEAILQPCHRLSLSKRPRQDTTTRQVSLFLSLDQSHCPTINTIKFLIESSKFIIQVQFVRREKIYNFVFDRILQLYLSRAVHYEIGTRVYRTQSRWTLSRSWHEWKTRRDCSSRIRRSLTVERRSSQQSNPERSLGDGIRKKLDARSNNRLLLEWFSAGESAQSTS